MESETDLHATCTTPIAFVGCGKLGTAVLKGLLMYDSSKDPKPAYHYNVCVASASSRQRLEAELYRERGKTTIYVQDNLGGIAAARIIILGCKPSQYQQVLAEPGMRDALKGKCLLSMLGGITSSQLAAFIHGDGHAEEDCTVLRAIPSVGAIVCKCITVVEQSKSPATLNAQNLAVDLFSRVGRVKLLPSEQLERGVVISASSPAFFAAISRAMLNSQAQTSMTKETTIELIAASMWSAAHLLYNGRSPDEICQLIATPGGSTACGLKTIADLGADVHLADALQATLEATAGLDPGRR